MTTVIESLKVEGNVPCPVPAQSEKPPPFPRKKPGSARCQENQSAKPVKMNSTNGPRINTEEDLKNIMLQAKSPPILGPTAVTKRFTYLSRIKQLNDGMYSNHSVPNTETKPAPSSLLKLEGRKVDSNTRHEVDTFLESAANNANGSEESEPAKCETSDQHVRSFKTSLSAKSGKSVRSIQSSKSDPSPAKSMTLPSLTIGASRPMTRGDYISMSKEETEYFSLAVGSQSRGAVRGELEDYEFRFHTPRKLHLRCEPKDGKLSDSTGNYSSLSLSDLKACLHVNHQNGKGQHQDDIIQGYIEQFKSTHKKCRPKINAYKMLKNSPRVKSRSMSPRYQFKNVDSYLRFNRNKEMGNLAKSMSNSAIRGEPMKTSYSDTVVVNVVSELNDPSPSRVTGAPSSSRLSEGGKEDILKIKRSQTLPAHCSSRNNSAKHSNEKDVIQHIIYVPSGQTAKIRLVKS